MKTVTEPTVVKLSTLKDQTIELRITTTWFHGEVVGRVREIKGDAYGDAYGGESVYWVGELCFRKDPEIRVERSVNGDYNEFSLYYGLEG